MKVLIIEDEHLAAGKLKQMLSNIDPSIEVAGMLESVQESVNWLMNNPAPDLIFMDIQLDDGVCFEIFESVKISTPVIFTTAYDQYAIKAFKVNSVDYLMKPVIQEDLESALNKFRHLYAGGEQQQEKINRLYDQLLKKDYKSRFFVKIGTHFHSISVHDIACFYVLERGTFIKSKVGKNYNIDYSLDQVQKMVDPDQFYRINRNYIINLNSIADIISYSTNRLKIKLRNFEHLEDLIVSRDKTGDFKKWLDR
jgi:DNA-binding LytR/AlgR family response regulator